MGGGQYKIKDRVGSWAVKDYKVLDNDAQYKPDYSEDLNYPIDKKVKEVDVVFCLEVMEYIWRPYVAHQNIFKFLKEGGIAYISYPTIYPLHNPPGIDYLRYTKNAIEKFLTESGFKSWEITSRIATAGQDSLADFYSLEQMRAMKGTSEIFNIGYMCKAVK